MEVVKSFLSRINWRSPLIPLYFGLVVMLVTAGFILEELHQLRYTSRVLVHDIRLFARCQGHGTMAGEQWHP